MIATTMRRLAPAFVTIMAVGAAVAHAADASAWDEDQRSGMRLLAGAHPAADGALRAGVEIRLAPDWKTYWRYPGDSGVPPRFDFAGSVNVRSATVLWPAPRRFPDALGESIGYEDRVVFPLRIVADDPARSSTLRLTLNYAICQKICVPVEAKADLALGAAAADSKALIEAEAQVPVPTPLGSAGPFAIRAVGTDSVGGKPRIIVDVAAPDDAAVDLFAEGPTDDWALPLPKPIDGAPTGLRRFAFALDGLPPGATADGAMLTLTAVSGTQAIETRVKLK